MIISKAFICAVLVLFSVLGLCVSQNSGTEVVALSASRESQLWQAVNSNGCKRIQFFKLRKVKVILADLVYVLC